MLNPRFPMASAVRLPDGEHARIIGIYLHVNRARPQYLAERKDDTGVLYQTWHEEDELTEA